MVKMKNKIMELETLFKNLNLGEKLLFSEKENYEDVLQNQEKEL